jgi:hypothetical protein
MNSTPALSRLDIVFQPLAPSVVDPGPFSRVAGYINDEQLICGPHWKAAISAHRDESSGASFTDAESQMTTKRKRPRLNLRRSAILLHRAPKIQGQPLSCRCYLMEMAA